MVCKRVFGEFNGLFRRVFVIREVLQKYLIFLNENYTDIEPRRSPYSATFQQNLYRREVIDVIGVLLTDPRSCGSTPPGI